MKGKVTRRGPTPEDRKFKQTPKHRGTLSPSGLVRQFQGITFRPYRVGISMYALQDDSARIYIHQNGRRSTYSGMVDGVTMAVNFRSEETAIKAAVTLMMVNDEVGEESQ